MKKGSLKYEDDCREIIEERLFKLLNQSTAGEVQKFAKSLGCKTYGSKLDMILQPRRVISEDNSKFNKAFSKLLGYSGGCISGVCPHGVVYFLKFVLQAESPRDYVDLLLSTKHLPNVCIVDMAHVVVAHGNKRKPNMFSPYSGIVTDVTDGNIEKATQGLSSLVGRK